MKKIVLAIAAAFILLLPSCNKENVEESGSGPVTISVAVPETTSASDAIYISGSMTGGDVFSVGNPIWKLTRSGQTCTIELDSENFIGGKTLADGFWFVSEAQGAEVDASGNKVIRTLDAKAGKTYSYVVAGWSN